jgi:hypothetical protein
MPLWGLIVQVDGGPPRPLTGGGYLYLYSTTWNPFGFPAESGTGSQVGDRFMIPLSIHFTQSLTVKAARYFPALTGAVTCSVFRN